MSVVQDWATTFHDNLEQRWPKIWDARQRTKFLCCVGFVVVAGMLPAIKGGIAPIHLVFGVFLPALLIYAWRRPWLRALWGASLLWTLGQMAVNHGKGLSMVASAAILGVLVALMVTGLMWMRDSLALDDVHLIGLTVLVWFLQVLNTDALSTDDPWKFGVGETAIPLVMVLVGGSRSWRRHLLAVAVVAELCLTNDSRSLLGFAFMALFWAWLKSRLPRERRGAVVVAAVVMGLLAYLAYPVVAVNGLLGPRAQAQQKTFDHNNANWLMANRKEVPQLWYLARTHFPGGIGTYGPVSQAEADEAVAAVRRAAGPLTPEDVFYLQHDVATVGYHSHSQFFASLLYGGLFPLAFWLLFYLLLVRGFVGASPREGPHQVAWIFVLLDVLWNSMFSPFSETTVTSMAVALAIVLIQIYPHTNPNLPPKKINVTGVNRT